MNPKKKKFWFPIKIAEPLYRELAAQAALLDLSTETYAGRLIHRGLKEDKATAPIDNHRVRPS